MKKTRNARIAIATGMARGKTVRAALIVAASCAVAACSTQSAPPPPPPNTVTTTLPSGGVYKGIAKSAADGATSNATLLVLFDGTAYLFYGDADAAVAIASGGTQTSDGHFSGASALDYRIGRAPASPVIFSADFANAPAVAGTVANQDGSARLAFTVTATPMLDAGPTLARAGGLYNGRGMALGGTTSTRITVAGDGYAAGTTASGCIFKGAVAPRAGANAYDVSVTFGPAPCPLPDATVNGGAVLDGAHLLVALPSPDRSNVFLFDGRK